MSSLRTTCLLSATRLTNAASRYVSPVLLVFALLCAMPSAAQEISVSGGVGRANAPSESTYSWGFTYLQPLDAYNALSYSWINEGHYTDHHPDGFALQYWRRLWLFNDRLALAGGIGAYNFSTQQRLTKANGMPTYMAGP